MTGQMSVRQSRRLALCAAFCLVSFCIALISFATAHAGSRGVGVGIGVGAGLQILNQLSKGATASKGSAKKRTATGSSNKKTTRKAKQQRDNSGEAKTTAKRDETPEPEQAKTEPQPSLPAAAAAATVPAAAVAAPTVTGAVPTDSGQSASLISTREEVTSAQEHLRYLGYDVPAMTGVIDLNTKIAIMKFQDSIGAPPTGGLTVDQLQKLYARAFEQNQRAK